MNEKVSFEAKEAVGSGEDGGRRERSVEEEEETSGAANEALAGSVNNALIPPSAGASDGPPSSSSSVSPDGVSRANSAMRARMRDGGKVHRWMKVHVCL